MTHTMTQTEQVMDMLGKEEWVCGVSFQKNLSQPTHREYQP